MYIILCFLNNGKNEMKTKLNDKTKVKNCQCEGSQTKHSTKTILWKGQLQNRAASRFVRFIFWRSSNVYTHDMHQA